MQPLSKEEIRARDEKHREALRQQQENCSHSKKNSRAALVGQRSSTGDLLYVCQNCLKSFTAETLPPYLAVTMTDVMYGGQVVNVVDELPISYPMPIFENGQIIGYEYTESDLEKEREIVEYYTLLMARAKVELREFEARIAREKGDMSVVRAEQEKLLEKYRVKDAE